MVKCYGKKVEDTNGDREQGKHIENSMNMVDINPTIPIVTFNVSGLNTPIKR